MRHRWSGFAVVAVVVSSLMMAGCSWVDEKDKNDAFSREDADRLADLYLGERIDFIDYAQREIRKDCMLKAGYPQPKAAGNRQYKALANRFRMHPRGFRGFTSEANAREHGFGFDSAGELGSVVSFDANFDKANDRCVRESEEKLGPETRKTLQAYSDLGNAISDDLAVWKRKRIPEGIPGMLDCMEGKGFTVVSRDIKHYADMKFFAVPLGDLEGGKKNTWEPERKQGTVQTGPSIPPSRYIPTPQESELAVAWHQCNEQTGRVTKLLDEGNDVVSKAIRKREATFSELNPKIEAIARQAAQFVKQ